MEFVTLEIAKKLKWKGYPQHISENGYTIINGGEDKYEIGYRLPIPLVNDYMEDIDAPTISQVLEWLREEKKIAINIEFIPYVWQYKILDMSFESSFEPCGLTLFSNYEEAALAGIEYTLDNLI
jgi:hypothetical protein